MLLRVFGLSWGRSAEGGLLLGQGGEFAFIVIGMALALGLLERQVGQFMLIVVGVSMLAAPRGRPPRARAWATRIDRRIAPPAAEDDAELGELGGHVIIAGYGRVGQIVGQMLAEQGVGYVAIENDAQLIAHQRKAGVPLVFGDASRPELLRKLRIDQARAVVLTMDHTAAAIHAVQGIRRMVPMMRIIARARDEKHALLLREAGASVVVPETLESSLKLTGWVLETLGVPPDAALRLLEQERERRIVALRDTGNAPDRPLTTITPPTMTPQSTALHDPQRKPRIALLATGGTIAGTAGSATDTSGYTAGQLGPEALLAAVPQLPSSPASTPPRSSTSTART